MRVWELQTNIYNNRSKHIVLIFFPVVCMVLTFLNTQKYHVFDEHLCQLIFLYTYIFLQW